MELKNSEYKDLLCYIDDLKKICEKLKMDLNLLEIPIHKAVKLAESSSLEGEGSSASSASFED